MHWIASPDDFADRVHKQVVREHPNVRRTQVDTDTYMWQDGTTGYAMMTVRKDAKHVVLTFLKFPDIHIRPDEEHPYAEASLESIAAAIVDWITELKK